MKKILCSLCAICAALVPASALLRAAGSASLATDYTFPDIENWSGSNWQAAGWPAVRLKKNSLEKSIVQLGFDAVSPYNTGGGPNFLLRVQLDGRFVFLTNSNEIATNRPGALMMQKKGRVFEGMLPRGGMLTDAAVDYGRTTVHYTAGDLNPGNANDPRFTSLRFIPADENAGSGGEGDAVWDALALGIPVYYSGPNWAVATWPEAQGKVAGKNAMVRIGYDASSVYRGGGKTTQQNFLCRLVFKTGGTIFLTNSAEVARRKGDVIIMEQKDGCFEAVAPGLGELNEVAIDFGESTLAYGRGTWSLNAGNEAGVRFNSLEIFPAQPAPAPAQAAGPPSEGALLTKGEYSAPAYYGGPNWLVAVFTGARGLKLAGKDTTLRLHFDSASCFNAGESVAFLLRVVFEDGKTIYASNSGKIVAAAPGERTAMLALDKTSRCFEGSLAGLSKGGVVREIAVDFGGSTSHLPVPLNARNNNNPRFTKLTVMEAP